MSARMLLLVPAVVAGAVVVSSAPGALGQVAYQRIAAADRETSNWLTYSGNYASHR